MFRYLYLYDLKVNREYRRNSIGIGLTRKTSETCHSLGCKGIYTQAQDNNLAARRFCLDNGFVIGGIDTIVYKGTVQ